ncbi:YggS family pyridoxal phosphate-dependent enzyme [Lachnospiraceae bacterium OttesenSCG-928-D06]|nr:YggS family pyridoxal phosphate-dependent enzyme [Lachnospiraceae bacterium OttesenSCG-928-D06]
MIQENIKEILEGIEQSCTQKGRDAKDVTLIAVSKYKPIEMIQEAYENHIRDFGENRVQELLEKEKLLPKDIRWHMIGHLQRNKVRSIIDKVYMIHGVDSLRLAEEISKEAVKQNLIVNILVEVNVAKEESKDGIFVEEAISFVENVAKLPGLCIKGLMTIAPYVKEAEENRQIFIKLRELAVDISNKNIDNVTMNVLSMGMTGDYLVAVEEGATYVRVGTGIFGDRDYSSK